MRVLFPHKTWYERKKTSIIYFSRLVDKLFNDGYLCAKAADDTKHQYEEFLEEVEQEHREKFKQFDMKQNRIDEFLGLYLNGNKKYEGLWNLCIIIFTLSHGQSDVERGFGVNSDLEVENLKEDSLVAQCLIYDFITSLNIKLAEYNIPKELQKSCKLVSSRYKEALRLQNDDVVENTRCQKKKMKLEEISEIQRT